MARSRWSWRFPSPGWVLAATLSAAMLPAPGLAPAQGAPSSAQVGVGNAAPAPVLTAHQRDEAQRAFIGGAKAIEAHDLPLAVQRFGQASSFDPTNVNYSAALNIARQDRITELVQQSLKARLRGDTATFRARLAEAKALDAQGPIRNPLVAQHAGELDEAVLGGAPDQAIPGAAAPSIGGPVELAPRLLPPQDFHLLATRDQVMRQVLEAYGLLAIFDKSLAPAAAENTRVRLDQEGVTFAQALLAAELATNTFLVPLDPQRALVALDTKENRVSFERLAQETIYLPGLTATEMSDVGNIARNIFEAQQATIDENAHTMVVRAPEAKLKPLNLMLADLMEGRSEVLLDLHFYEVSRTRDVSEGAELPSSSSIFNVTSEVNSLLSANPSLVQQIISSGLATPGNYEEIALALVLSGQAGSTLLSQPFAVFGGGLTTTGLTLTQAAANLTLNTSDTRMLDQVQLRLLDQEEGTVKVGEQYPIVTSSYSNLASAPTNIAGISTAGLSNTLANLGINLSSLQNSASATVPQVQYQDLGLTLHATSRVQKEQEVSLKLDLQLTSLAGPMLNGNPVLTSRQFQSIVTLKPGEKALLVSSLNTQESAALIGLPFLSEIPGFRFGTNETINKTRSSLVIAITPRVVRLSHRTGRSQLVLLPQHS